MERAEPTSSLRGDPAAAASPRGLADRRELALIAVERTWMPMVVTDPRQRDNPIVLANRSFLSLCGYSAEEVIGRNCRFLQGQETSPNAVAELRAAVEAGRDAHVELLNYRRDGSTFWCHLHISAIHSDDGELLYFFGTQQDVTARRVAESLKAAEVRLLREVDHRAMNVLALVNAIVRLSSAEDPKRYAAAIQGRIQALASAHSALASRAWTRLPLKDLLMQQLPSRSVQQVSLRGPETAVSAAHVQPLALVFHELFSNAARHGALSVPEGALHIAWGESNADHILIDWNERGGPRPASDRPRGFGSKMIRSIVERQLRGKLCKTWSDAGLIAKLEVPLQREDAAP